MTEYIVKEITENLDKIFANVDRESIEVYRFLKSEFEKGNILDNSYYISYIVRFTELDGAGLSEKIRTRILNSYPKNRTILQ